MPDQINIINSNADMNLLYTEELDAYNKNPCAPCDKPTALKLLKRFYNLDFSTFWHTPVSGYFPAVSAGIMKTEEMLFEHDEAIEYTKALISKFDPKELARAYLYGVANNEPSYCTALASYYYIKNLPQHNFTARHLGSFGQNKDVYSDNKCEICLYSLKPSNEPKMRFWYINISMDWFYLGAKMPYNFNLNHAIIYLNEFVTLEKPAVSEKDYEFFLNILHFISETPEAATPSKLTAALKKSGILKMTKSGIDAFADMMGYLNILHTPECFGVTKGHICEKNVSTPWTDSAYPFCNWKRKYGIDYQSVSELFGECYIK